MPTRLFETLPRNAALNRPSPPRAGDDQLRVHLVGQIGEPFGREADGDPPFGVLQIQSGGDLLEESCAGPPPASRAGVRGRARCDLVPPFVHTSVAEGARSAHR
jgi:hypothetical protein